MNVSKRLMPGRFQLLNLSVLLSWSLVACADGNDGNSVPRLPEPANGACELVANDASVVVGSGLPDDPASSELSSGYRVGKTAARAEHYMVVSANPLASKAGCDVLRAGGNAVDAAVAVQMVLGLVEPQSSGVGGGAFMLYYDAATGKVVAYDGRETAPAAATENYLRYVDDQSDHREPLPNTRASGRSIGVPGAVRMLGLAHAEHGNQPWSRLFESAITLAENGFPVGGRMAAALEDAKGRLSHDADAVAVYFKDKANTWAQGERFVNKPYANTLKILAKEGADALYQGPLAQAIVDKVATAQSTRDGSVITPGKMTLADLHDYRPKVREAVCTTYRARYRVCGMPPPSSGGLAVAQTLGILEHFDLAALRPSEIGLDGGVPSVMGVHLVSEANRLAYADRDKYVADTDFVPLPGGSWDAMLAPAYLRQRAGLISMTRTMGVAKAGDLGGVPQGVVPIREAGTSHVSIVDAKGNAVSMTTTVEGGMGSFHVTHGFVLNNQLTDFSSQPSTDEGPVANRVQPGKRPRSSMAPTLVFDLNADGSTGRLKMATGSPGGGTIIQFVSKTLVGVLDWGLDAQQATSMVDFGASNNGRTIVGGEHPIFDGIDPQTHPLVQGLTAMGHDVLTNSQSSGIGTIVRVDQGAGRFFWEGGADPRREGVALGD